MSHLHGIFNVEFASAQTRTGRSIKDFTKLIAKGNFWKLKVMFFGILLAFIVSPPSLKNIHLGNSDSYWPTVETQIAHPFQPIHAHPKSHAANKSFRLTVPILAKIFRLDRKGIFMIQSSLIIVMMWSILTIAFNITSSKLNSTLITIALIPSYPLICAYQETTGHLDAFAYTFLLLSMTFRRSSLIFLFCTLASWCDERAFIATSLIFLWWYIQENGAYTMTREETLTPNRSALAVITSGLVYIITRSLLIKFSSLHISMEKPDFTILPQYIYHIPLLTFLTFGVLWLFPLLGLFYLFKTRKFLTLSMYLIACAIIFIISSLVWDFTRSLAFLLPGIIASIFIIKNFLSPEIFRVFLLTGSISSVMLPSIHFDSQFNYVPSLLYTLITLAINYANKTL